MAEEFPALFEKDGLAQNTALVFWSDHGLGMPHGKRWIDDSDTGMIADLVLLEAIKPGGQATGYGKAINRHYWQQSVPWMPSGWTVNRLSDQTGGLIGEMESFHQPAQTPQPR